eukprot:TRINITY_DN2349_c1_g1_i3.p1 TRINITY_DN2349_c1_g1~~TRINITY_DN2349_c1_g1_i3.p1  ORF type:complete len:230 (+),score=55.65 TRINITY_DN2349_c1_g1_i3:209-898(+)
MDKEPVILGYWDIRGLAEPIRMLMQHLGINYKDVTYEAGPAPEYSRDAWFKVKHTMGFDFPNIPYLIDSSAKITESNAILRYLCHKHDPKLLGTTPEEKVYVDVLAGILRDIVNGRFAIAFTEEPDKLPLRGFARFHEKIERVAKALEGKKYLLGESLSYVDFVCAEYFECINDVIDPVFTKYPSLKQHFETIMSLPNIKKYRESEEFVKNPKPYHYKAARLGNTPLNK